MFGIGMPELLLILAIALIIIGPSKLPEIAKALGRAMGEFKKATSDLKASMEIDEPISHVKRSFDDFSRDVNQSINQKPVESSSKESKAEEKTTEPEETPELSTEIPEKKSDKPSEDSTSKNDPPKTDDTSEKQV